MGLGRLRTRLDRVRSDKALDDSGSGPRGRRGLVVAGDRVRHRGPHPGDFRSEASFAGVSAIPASSGLTNRHRINRSGDRQLNRALHTITLIRMRLDPATKTYVARRIGEGKTSRDAQRCLKRAVCRQLFKILERSDRTPTISSEPLDAI
ncbi:transposase [Streptomyces sp. NPDC000658]|uniref:transposase n=1 Tax=Streptomyces sp. NPDC000658 TaxID=3154266 RepID=UPI003327A52A